MFTGIIQNRGRVLEVIENFDGRTFWIGYEPEWPSLALGDSLAINGTCLTVEELRKGGVRLTAIAQTLALTTLSSLKGGDNVNLETAATMNSALGGHLVSGHIDGIAQVLEIIPRETGREVILEIPESLQKYTVPKGSICFDGISLTIAEKTGSQIRVALIPETVTRTSAGDWQPGDSVNLEVDQMAKYFENFFNLYKGEMLC